MIAEIFHDLRERGAVQSEAQFARDYLRAHRGYMYSMRAQAFAPSAEILVRLHGALVSRGYPNLADRVMRSLLSGESGCARVDTQIRSDVA